MRSSFMLKKDLDKLWPDGPLWRLTCRLNLLPYFGNLRVFLSFLLVKTVMFKPFSSASFMRYSAARSLTEPPGLRCSALAVMSHPRNGLY